ncbi:fatty-acyl-CoA synthase [Hoeflea marina]|uniref:Fatty-acyl-CoA synthase n=2 Tax=Hoeflea marina TaxID=274592 RepID=A0A317PNA2_9HYPH|nr:fatty-acyl-CoA synthase [Hoeflea marina]
MLGAVPGTAALVDVRSGERVGKARLVELVARRTGEFADIGVRRGDRVIVAEANPLQYLVSILACWAGGHVAVAVNPAISAHEQQNVIDMTGATCFRGDCRAIVAQAEEPETAAPSPLHPDEPALILMTSGTTGRPKGIVHSLRGLTARIALNIAHLGRPVLSDTLCMLPVFFGHGLIGNVLTPLHAGGTVLMWPTPDMAELRGLGALIDDHRIRFLSSVPTMWKMALRLAEQPKRPLERIHIGSAPLSAGLWQQVCDWGGTRQVFNMFGMTETANWIGGGAIDEGGARDGHVGQMWGGSAAILADTGDILPYGRGEVLVQTPSIMLGYWRRPDLDAEAFIGNWFRTGDIGVLDEAGTLALTGRIKTEINRAGIKIQAEEIDMLLERHEAVAEACGFGIPDPVSGEAVAAAVVLKAGAEADPEALKAWCRRQARPDAVPARIAIVEAIPRNDRGKVVRADVRAFVEGRMS